MNWIDRWFAQRRVRALKQRIARMRNEVKASSSEETMMPALDTFNHQVLMERIGVLEKAVEKIESGRIHSPDISP